MSAPMHLPHDPPDPFGAITWPMLVVALVAAYWRWLVGGMVAAALLAGGIYHASRDNDLKTRIMDLESTLQACNDVRAIARSIDNSPGGSRTELGRTLARR